MDQPLNQPGVRGTGHSQLLQRDGCEFRGMTESKVVFAGASVAAALNRTKQQRGPNATGKQQQDLEGSADVAPTIPNVTGLPTEPQA